MGESRNLRRKLQRNPTKKNSYEIFTDNRGNEFDHQIAATLSSLLNFFGSCCKNGFPVVVPFLWYGAWAFYPFFFVRGYSTTQDPIALLNHERIHIRQQRDLHLWISIPLLVLSFWIPRLLWVVPFVPTIFYMVELLRVAILTLWDTPPHKINMSFIRRRTCYEMEAEKYAQGINYLLHRKPFAVYKFIKS